MTQPQTVDERALLRSNLDAQRNHVVGILADLSAVDLRRQVLPSGWTCLGLVKHLALDVERFWFRAVVAGEQTVIDSLADLDDGWQVGPEVTPEKVFELYWQEINRANAIIEATALDVAPAWWPDFFSSFRYHDLREVILHVITETACHAGHADVVREIIDGRRWMVLTE